MFKFTIRELLLLTLVVGLSVGWWIDRSRLGSERDSLVVGRQSALADSLRWEHRANYLATKMREIGWRIEWHEGRSGVDSVMPPD